MARYDHLPIWKDAVSLAVLLEEAVRRFPRYHKSKFKFATPPPSEASYAP